MTGIQQIITVLVAGAATLVTRFLPFVAFRRGIPRFVRYLGAALPGAIFGMLVIYCLKDVDVLAGSHGIPEALAILVTAASYLWRKNMLLSVVGGTAFYMVLVSLVFI